MIPKCHWGIQGILSKDLTKDQVIGNLRMLVRLGFTERIVEVVSGKVLEFTLANGEVQIDEMEYHKNYFLNADLIRGVWDSSFECYVLREDWKYLSPASARLFLPSEQVFFEQLNNYNGPPVYIESIGSVIARIDVKRNETPPGLDDALRDRFEEYRKIFYTALKFNFTVTISG
ncbi:MAG TPA: hypothetical protein VK826_08655 [Bacteroidia bacterium]|nr:hypothetical protein [Bacteroidia bacterium]